MNIFSLYLHFHSTYAYAYFSDYICTHYTLMCIHYMCLITVSKHINIYLNVLYMCIIIKTSNPAPKLDYAKKRQLWEEEKKAIERCVYIHTFSSLLLYSILINHKPTYQSLSVPTHSSHDQLSHIYSVFCIL